ncbi:hemolysin activation/secretion protein [Actinobacillus lignieresii]|uniref:Hemolysin activation/secretion protein n=1 Tax=Actinobacillus lignieresii TaxID=720 RepID=A0A380TS59_ACTLI|nr:hemolysin activation/secretion protein [Actinobacillus lignieresii]
MYFQPKFLNIPLAAVSISVSANQYSSLSELNQLDAAQQQRQQQYQQSKDKQLQASADVRLDTDVQQPFSFLKQESPCYPIHHISLTDYGSSTSTSQFQ